MSTILHFSVPTTRTGIQCGQTEKSLRSPPPSNSNQQLLNSTEDFLKVFLHGLWHGSSTDLGTHGRKAHSTFLPLNVLKLVMLSPDKVQ